MRKYLFNIISGMILYFYADNWNYYNILTMGAGIPLFKSSIEEGMRATPKGQLDKLRSGATSARGFQLLWRRYANSEGTRTKRNLTRPYSLREPCGNDLKISYNLISKLSKR
ncbi:hypothetical protein [Spirulina sp. 06S082]|uniref:hypothetical protein n=1 Tax=Spirulina sp. 06S082 TaxID=3110248 RepID=UPI002B211A9A|nr:hypothetical protein [Spirulina sp. 06S082]MEA5471413.1 hypothetical protein [Spirulina sp. 06S082]